MRRGDSRADDAAREPSCSAADDVQSDDDGVLSFDEYLAMQTGKAIPEDVWRERQRRQAELIAQTEWIAKALESQKIEAFAKGEPIALIGELTGQIDIVRDYRAIRFLPVVAQRRRQPMLQNLRYFEKASKRHRYLRYAVITAGERVPLYGPLRETMMSLTRRISRFASEAKKRYGVDVVFRGTEFPIDHDRSFHVHANLIYLPPLMDDDVWTGFLEWTHRFFGTQLQDAGRLKKPEEVLKYPFKPNDLSRLDSTQLAWVYYETQRLKIVQPMGLFRLFCKNLEDKRRKVVTIDTENGRALRLMARPRKPSTDGKWKASAGKAENMVVYRTTPQARFTNVKEPITAVRGFKSEPTTLDGKQRLEALNAHLRAARDQ